MGEFKIHDRREGGYAGTVTVKTRKGQGVDIKNYKNGEGPNSFKVVHQGDNHSIYMANSDGVYWKNKQPQLEMSSRRMDVFMDLMKADQSKQANDKKGEYLTFSDLEAAKKNGIKGGKVVIEDAKKGKARLDFDDGGSYYFDFQMPGELK